MKSGNFEKALLRDIIAVLILASFYAGGLSVFAQGEVGKDGTVETVPLDKDNLSKTDTKVESVTENAKNTAVESPASVKDAASSSNPEAGEDSEAEAEAEIISISDALRQGQLQHEKNLVDKFLFGIAVLFLLIAFLLFNSLPPSSSESDAS